MRPRAVGYTLGGAALVGAGVLGAQVVAAHRHPYVDADSAPAVTSDVGDRHNPPLRLVMLGDSHAAGVGVAATAETVGGRIAARLARVGWLVSLSSVAVSGSRAGDLGPQVSRALLNRPNVAVVLIGANDALRLTRLSKVRRNLADAVHRLRGAGVDVVVGCCPDLGAARAIDQPLRALIAWRGRLVARTQVVAVHGAEGTAVDLAAMTGPVFRADPGTLCTDAYHPNADGYRLWADVLLPQVARAVGRPSYDPRS